MVLCIRFSPVPPQHRADTILGAASVYAFRTSLLVLVPCLALLASCGGDDDSDDSSGGDDASSATTAKGDAGGTSNLSVKVPAIKDGNFEKGTVHIEVSGGKDFKVDLEGNGLATNGFALLTFASNDASVQISLSNDSKNEPGGLALTARQLATGGGWGTDCSVSVNDGDKELKGEFECKQVDGIEPGSVKTHRVHLKGTFSATR